MDIVTCLLQGALGHRDSMGNGEVLRPGDGLAISVEASLEYQATSESEILVFELGC